MDPKEGTSVEQSERDFTPREYQIEILDRSLKENVIIFLPTGSGKTFIAVMLMQNYIHLTAKKYSEGGYRMYFLVNTTPLVSQQAEAVRNLLPLHVGEYCGEMGVDNWDKEKWIEEQDKYQVLVMTAQIYLDMIVHTFTNPRQACLLVFDECHHAVNNHPMRQIMKQIALMTDGNMPKICGLTATLLNANVKPDKVNKEIETLEATFHAKVVRAVNQEMVLQFSTDPDETFIYYEESEFEYSNLVTGFVDEIINLIEQIELPDSGNVPDEQPANATLLTDLSCKPIKRVERALKDVVKNSVELGLYGTDVSLLNLAILIERLKSLSHDLLYRILTYVLTGIHHLRKKLTFYVDGDLQKKPLHFASDHVLKLVKIFENFSETSRAIVFVDRRSTAQALHLLFVDLKTMDEYKNIKSEFIVGVNQPSFTITRENVLQRNKNNAIMKKFNRGDLNVLFASNVIEEGVDIRACNLVIKFDMPITFRSYVQSKGRARNELSKYIVLAPQPIPSKTSFRECYNHFQRIDNALENIMCHEKDREEVSVKCEDDDDDLTHEFVIASGAKVTALTAISLINRYCSMLPHDIFTRPTPHFWIKKTLKDKEINYIGYLKLPINSPIKTIVEGIPRKSKESAKKLVALEVCKRLYEAGEFDSNLIPVGGKSELMFDPNIFCKWEDDYFLKLKGSKMVGKKKHFFDKHFSKWECSKPKAGLDTFMHVIKITPSYSYPENDRLQVFYNLLRSDSTFCILSGSPWPEIPVFQLFMNVGEVKVEVLSNSCLLELNNEEIKKLEEFHKHLFTHALPLLKKYTVSANSDDSNIDQYIISPVITSNGTFSLDWSTINTKWSFPILKKQTESELNHEPVTEDRYLHKVVIPWYRPELKTKYIVTKIRFDQNPQSPFPSDNVNSYADYFTQNYPLKIKDKTQPLLEVRAISSKINCLLPRSDVNSKKRKKQSEKVEETLVPELCHLLSFPSNYFLKVTLLPSALHRIHHLLLAEELRQTIVEEAHLGSMQLPFGIMWKELKVHNEYFQKEALSNQDVQDMSNVNCDMIQHPIDQSIFNDEEEPEDIERNLNVDMVTILRYNRYALKEVDPDKIFREEIIYEPPRIIPKVPPSLEIFKGIYSGHGPEIVDILTALTCCSSQDIVNYERLELLGDCFLKFAASIALFTYFPQLDEGKLTQLKGKIIGNRNLFFCGKAFNLPGFLKVNSFDISDWKVPGFSLMPKFHYFADDPIKCAAVLRELRLKEIEEPNNEIRDSYIDKLISDFYKKTSQADDNMDDSDSSDDFVSTSKDLNFSCNSEYIMKHMMSEKIVADSVEALLGVYVKNFGVRGGLKFLNWMSVLPQSICDVDWLLTSEAVPPLLSPSSDLSTLLPKCDALESSLGYKFKNKGHLLQALSHSSSVHNLTDCYQRYEFLGDAVLDFVLTCYIFEKCQKMNPGELTDLRSALVNNVTFACLTVRHRFHTHLLNRAYQLTDTISKFVKQQILRNHEIGPQIFYLLEESEYQVAESVEVPKVLGDIFESLIGAIYLDCGKNLDCVWKVIYNIMGKEIEEFSKNVPKNLIRVMYETFSSGSPRFGKAQVKGSNSVMIPLEVVCGGKVKIFHGIGNNKYSAKIAASKLALHYFRNSM